MHVDEVLFQAHWVRFGNEGRTYQKHDYGMDAADGSRAIDSQR